MDQEEHPPEDEPQRAALAQRLRRAGCVAAEDEARELIDTAPDRTTLGAWIARREQGEPLEWITGRLLFCGQTMRMLPGVYVPRPQSEQLAERAARALPPGGSAADLCTGSGAVAVHLAAAVPSASVIGIDIDPRAVECARANGVDARVGDIAELTGEFDVITAVPPYVPRDELRLLPADVLRFEPRVALDGGEDGLDLARVIVAAAARTLRPGGWVFVELGGDQGEGLAPELQQAGFRHVEAWVDEDDDVRGIQAQQGHSAQAR